jgi:hypothetical protein
MEEIVFNHGYEAASMLAAGDTARAKSTKARIEKEFWELAKHEGIVALLEAAWAAGLADGGGMQENSAELLTLCSWCKGVIFDGPVGPQGEVSHGLCYACAVKHAEEFRLTDEDLEEIREAQGGAKKNPESYESRLIEHAPRYLWHLTCKANFEIEPMFVPTLAYGTDRKISGPGLFLSDRPNYWGPWERSCKEVYAVLVEHSGNIQVPSHEHPEFVDMSPDHARVVKILDIKSACEKYPDLFDAAAFQVYDVDATDWGKESFEHVDGHTRWSDDGDVVFSDIAIGKTFVWLVEYFRAEARSLDRSDVAAARVYEKVGNRKYCRVGDLYVHATKHGVSDEAVYTARGKTFELQGDVRVEAVVPVSIQDEDDDDAYED